MKKELIKSIKILTLALLIGVGTSLVFGEWNEQTTDNPPLGNSPVPINESSVLQTKSGELDVTNGANTGTVSADMLTVFGTSYFGNEVSVGDEDEATPSVDMHVTGKVGVNLDSFGVGTTPQVELDVAGTGSFRDLSAVAGVTYPAHLCVSTDGSLKVCPPPPVLTANISGPTVTNQSPGAGGGTTHHCSADVNFSSTLAGGDYPYSYVWKVKNNSKTTVIDGTTVLAGVWKTLDTTVSTTFHVFVVDPGDDWTINLTVTDGSYNTDVVTQNFDVWTIAGCAD